jgi:hypothetical protein
MPPWTLRLAQTPKSSNLSFFPEPGRPRVHVWWRVSPHLIRGSDENINREDGTDESRSNRQSVDLSKLAITNSVDCGQKGPPDAANEKGLKYGAVRLVDGSRRNLDQETAFRLFMSNLPNHENRSQPMSGIIQLDRTTRTQGRRVKRGPTNPKVQLAGAPTRIKTPSGTRVVNLRSISCQSRMTAPAKQTLQTRSVNDCGLRIKRTTRFWTYLFPSPYIARLTAGSYFASLAPDIVVMILQARDLSAHELVSFALGGPGLVGARLPAAVMQFLQKDHIFHYIHPSFGSSRLGLQSRIAMRSHMVNTVSNMFLAPLLAARPSPV